jgi:hypothetical protein
MDSGRCRFKKFPVNTLLILDNFAGHPLLRKVDGDLNRMLTKTRHYHLTVILAIQTWRFVPLNFKRTCSDIVIYQGYGIEDFQTMIKQTPGSFNKDTMWEIYSKLSSPHAYIAFHSSTNTYDVIE